ncbi:MAG: HNH endonuclease [Spirochaetaceae bacterium]|nr:HNH endonuclease [Spirochaetaceae bacterium]
MTFDERIRKAISDTKTECNYNPKAFIQMVNTYGALETVKRLLVSKQNIASGLEKLWELGRLDLCFERIIFEPEWHDLFTKEELTEAKKRLKELNYDVSELSVEPLNKESKLDKNELTYWLLSCNENNYDVEKAYLKYHTIDWHQTNNQIAVNDIVYIYKTKPHQVVRFACRVKAVNKKSSNKKDRDCYKDSTPFENKDCYMTLEFQQRFEKVLPNMHGLETNGVSVIRSLMKVPENALKYIQDCDKEDRAVLRFDGTIPSDIPHTHWSLVGGDEEELQLMAESEAKSLSDSELYEKAKQRSSLKPSERVATISTYVRDVYVAEASKRRAKGICQLCEKPAPFNDKNGNPYLECHHIIWLSEGGADELRNTVALCPNCHKKMHIVNDDEDVKKLQKLNS